MKKPKKRDSIIANRLLEIVGSVTGEEMYKKTRRREVITARSIFYKIMRDSEKWSFADAASVFELDHATSRHAINRLNSLLKMKSERDVKDLYDRCLALHNRVVDTKSELTEIELIEKISLQDAKILELNSYIADLEAKNEALKTKDTPFESVFNVIRTRMPLGKSEQAARKITAVLNGI
jgi:hypothetical protein